MTPSMAGPSAWMEEQRSISDRNDSKSAIDPLPLARPLQWPHSAQSMVSSSNGGGSRQAQSGRRIVVVLVPPVDELDLVGPLQVFNSVNRLAGRTIYKVEIVTNAERLTVEGESGVLAFIAKDHFERVGGGCDSVLLVCGLGSRSVRDPALSAWLRK